MKRKWLFLASVLASFVTLTPTAYSSPAQQKSPNQLREQSTSLETAPNQPEEEEEISAIERKTW